MAEYSPEEIIERAQQQQATRQIASQASRDSRERPWRYAFFGLLGALLLGLLAWPGVPLDRKLQAVGHGICAQVHAVELGGLTLPICARNTGIYASFLITSLYLLALGRRRAGKLPPIGMSIVLLLFVAAMAVDGFNSLFVDLLLPHLYEPRNELRTLTGAGMGIAIAVLLFLMLNISLRQDVDTNQPVIANWRELGGAILLNLLVLLAIYANISIFFWPIAIVSAVGIVGVLYCVNVLVAAILLRYDGQVTRFIQLARPATLALLFTVGQLALLAGVRFWLEGQGLVPV